MSVYRKCFGLDNNCQLFCVIVRVGGLCKKFLSQWLTQAFLNWNSKSIETETEINTGVTWRGVWQSHFKSPLVKTYWLQYTIDSKKCNFSFTKLCKFLDISGDVLLKPIIEAAGKDITHWFDKKTKDVSSCVYDIFVGFEPLVVTRFKVTVFITEQWWDRRDHWWFLQRNWTFYRQIPFCCVYSKIDCMWWYQIVVKTKKVVPGQQRSVLLVLMAL